MQQLERISQGCFGPSVTEGLMAPQSLQLGQWLRALPQLWHEGAAATDSLPPKDLLCYISDSWSKARFGLYLLTLVSATVPWVLQSLSSFFSLLERGISCLYCTFLQIRQKKKKEEQATLIPFAWGFFFCIQIIRSAAEIFRNSGPFWVQKGSYKHENLSCNGRSWCTSTATPSEHPKGIHVQGSRAVRSHALSRAFPSFQCRLATACGGGKKVR